MSAHPILAMGTLTNPQFWIDNPSAATEKKTGSATNAKLVSVQTFPQLQRRLDLNTSYPETEQLFCLI
jgi:hypothetical protein